MMNARLLLLLIAGALALTLRAETPAPEQAPTDPRDIAKREAWTSVVLIIALIEQGDNTHFPGLRAWLEDFRSTAASMPAPDAGTPFAAIDSDALVTRNPNFWRAFYEIQPGDPGLALLHSALLLCGGEAQRASAIAAFGMQRPGIPTEIKRALQSVIMQCQSAQAHSMAFVREGTKLHDRRDYANAIGFFERAISEWPANGAAHAERGLTFRARAVSEARARSLAEGPDAVFAPADPPETAASFAIARRHDPLNLLAYQGDDAATLAGLMALVQSGLPTWEDIRKNPEKPVRTDQLRRFSEACREAAIDDFALVLRQLVIAANRRSHPEDQKLITQCLHRLAPTALTSDVIARVGGEPRMPTRQIVVPAPDDSAEVAASAAAEAEKSKLESEQKPNAATTASAAKKPTTNTTRKGAATSSKTKGKSTAKSGSSSSKSKAKTPTKSGTSKSKSKGKKRK